MSKPAVRRRRRGTRSRAQRRRLTLGIAAVGLPAFALAVYYGVAPDAPPSETNLTRTIITNGAERVALDHDAAARRVGADEAPAQDDESTGGLAFALSDDPALAQVARTYSPGEALEQAVLQLDLEAGDDGQALTLAVNELSTPAVGPSGLASTSRWLERLTVTGGSTPAKDTIDPRRPLWGEGDGFGPRGLAGGPGRGSGEPSVNAAPDGARARPVNDGSNPITDDVLGEDDTVVATVGGLTAPVVVSAASGPLIGEDSYSLTGPSLAGGRPFVVYRKEQAAPGLMATNVTSPEDADGGPGGGGGDGNANDEDGGGPDAVVDLPEPPTAVLALVGLAFVTARRRKRRLRSARAA